jgi:hypothetical protein
MTQYILLVEVGVTETLIESGFWHYKIINAL